MRFIQQVRIENQQKRMAFGKKLKLIRKNNGLSQKELAKLLGCSVSTLSTYENGQFFPKPKTVHKLAELYNVPVDELLYGYAICPCCGKRMD